MCLSVSAYLKYPGRPNKCHTQEKFPLLSAHLQKLAINFDHSFPLWRAGARIIPLPGARECVVFRLLKYYSIIFSWFIDTMTPDSGDTWGDETIHCRTRAIVVTMSLTTPQHCPMSPAWPHVMPLIQQQDTFKNPFNSDRTIFSWLKFIICKLMVNWCWKHPCIAGC